MSYREYRETIFCHEGGDSAMIFTSDEVTRENHCRAESHHEWQKSLFTVTNPLFYFLHAIPCGYAPVIRYSCE